MSHASGSGLSDSVSFSDLRARSSCLRVVADVVEVQTKSRKVFVPLAVKSRPTQERTIRCIMSSKCATQSCGLVHHTRRKTF